MNLTEVIWSGHREAVPQEARDVLRGVLRRAALVETLEMLTLRQRLILRDANDQEVAELDDDRVGVVGGKDDGFRFRQIQLKVFGDAGRWLGEVSERLLRCGFTVRADPKLAIALGSGASPSPPPELSDASPLGTVVHSALASDVGRLLDNDWRLRLTPSDIAPHDVHQARVATRRIRSNLKTFQVLLDPVWVRHVRADLEWLGSGLGDVRDIDVLTQQLDGLPDELLRRLAVQRAAAGAQLAAVLASNRYQDLLDRLDAASQRPPFLSHGVASAETPARDALPSVLGARWDALRRQVGKAKKDTTPRRLHRVRIEAKRLRYAAEAAVPAPGGVVKRIASEAEQLQEVLGSHRDAVTAENWLCAQVHRAPLEQTEALLPRTAYEAGRRSAEQRYRQQEVLRHWQRSWDSLNRPKIRHWLG